MANLFRANKKGSGEIQVDSLTITQMPTKTSYATGDALDLTGLAVSATIAGITGDVTSLVTVSPANGSILSTEGTITITITYYNASTTFNVSVANIPANLNDASWTLIQQLLQAGTLGDYYNEGDTKEITLTTGETLTLQLASINDGTGTAGIYYPNHTADFISVELMDSTHVMNSTATNVGGWNDSEMRAYLNETVYPTLPTSLKNIVVDKTHMRTAGKQSHDLVSASDKLWLPTTYEMFGENSQYYLDDSDHNIYYSIFPDNASRIKYRKAAPTSAHDWWLSSPKVSASAYFAYVYIDGSRNNNSANYSAGVVLGLRIG